MGDDENDYFNERLMVHLYFPQRIDAHGFYWFGRLIPNGILKSVVVTSNGNFLMSKCSAISSVANNAVDICMQQLHSILVFLQGQSLLVFAVLQVTSSSNIHYESVMARYTKAT